MNFFKFTFSINAIFATLLQRRSTFLEHQSDFETFVSLLDDIQNNSVVVTLEDDIINIIEENPSEILDYYFNVEPDRMALKDFISSIGLLERRLIFFERDFKKRLSFLKLKSNLLQTAFRILEDLGALDIYSRCFCLLYKIQIEQRVSSNLDNFDLIQKIITTLKNYNKVIQDVSFDETFSILYVNSIIKNDKTFCGQSINNPNDVLLMKIFNFLKTSFELLLFTLQESSELNEKERNEFKIKSKEFLLNTLYLLSDFNPMSKDEFTIEGNI